jgi:hypothetical protein
MGKKVFDLWILVFVGFTKIGPCDLAESKT